MAARNCKVIATCFAGREVREESDFCGDPPGLFMPRVLWRVARAAGQWADDFDRKDALR